jgi:hypothetical protein
VPRRFTYYPEANPPEREPAPEPVLEPESVKTPPLFEPGDRVWLRLEWGGPRDERAATYMRARVLSEREGDEYRIAICHGEVERHVPERRLRPWAYRAEWLARQAILTPRKAA